MVFDRLLVRHWDTWENGTRNHLFVYPLPSGPARDLMRPMDADCPSKPFGGSNDYAISPDGKTVVFSAKDAGREEAWSTNFDLFAVPTDGSAAPRKLTTNPAMGQRTQVLPDGRTLAYLAMSRAGYEADRYEIVLRDVATGIERTIDASRRRLRARGPVAGRSGVVARRQGALLRRRAPRAERDLRCGRGLGQGAHRGRRGDVQPSRRRTAAGSSTA